MLNLDNFYKKDDNYIEVIDYTKKGISKKAFMFFLKIFNLMKMLTFTMVLL